MLHILKILAYVLGLGLGAVALFMVITFLCVVIPYLTDKH